MEHLDKELAFEPVLACYKEGIEKPDKVFEDMTRQHCLVFRGKHLVESKLFDYHVVVKAKCIVYMMQNIFGHRSSKVLSLCLDLDFPHPVQDCHVFGLLHLFVRVLEKHPVLSRYVVWQHGEERRGYYENGRDYVLFGLVVGMASIAHCGVNGHHVED